jgi:hypothetical protein
MIVPNHNTRHCGGIVAVIGQDSPQFSGPIHGTVPVRAIGTCIGSAAFSKRSLFSKGPMTLYRQSIRTMNIYLPQEQQCT